VTSSDPNPPTAALALLDGVKVLTLGAFVAGNVCPQILGELGADVVKVETRKRPEALRHYFSHDHGEITEPGGFRTTAMYSLLSRSMSSVCVELDSPGGPEVLRSLAAAADIVIENLGPGVMEKWGAGYDDLAVSNPRLVMVSISGYGRTGTRGSHRAYASSISSYLGLTKIYAHEGTHFDFVAAYHAAFAALGAWRRALATGDGSYLDVSQMETGAAVMAPIYLDGLMNGGTWSAAPNEVPGSLLSTVVACTGNDVWAAVELEDSDDWATLCDVLERRDLRDVDPAELDHRGALQAALEAWASELTPLQVTIKLQNAGLAAAPVQNGEDIWRDPQLRARSAFVEVTHPDLGVIEHPQSPDYMAVAPGRITRRSRRLGEDTAEVLERWLGLDAAQRDDLEHDGAVWQAPED